MYRQFLLIFLTLLLSFSLKAQQAEPKLFVYENTNGLEHPEDVLRQKFKPHQSNLLNFGLGNKDYWIKTTVPAQHSATERLSLLIDQSRLAYVNVFYVKDNKVIFNQHTPHYNLVANQTATGNLSYFNIPEKIRALAPDILVHIKSNELFVAPLNIQTLRETEDMLTNRSLILGLYSGALLIMFIYNLFLYFSVRDRSYFFYVFYILFTWLTQISVQGFASKYLWPDNPWLHQYSVTVFSIIALLFGLAFTISFLNTRTFVPRFHKALQVIFGLTALSLAFSFSSYFYLVFAVMQLLTFLSCIIALWIATYVYYKIKFKPAGYYLLAWTILVIGILLFIGKDYQLIPYNNTSIYILQITSVIEATLLSFALADKINIFKKEKEDSQAEALRVLTENEKLIREQNTLLEIKVKERTEALENTNDTLSVTLTNLKEAQSQLVDAEKMAGLGQLTAGIAHEINNPINFVTSNIRPLNLDINDLNEVIAKYEQIDINKDIPAQLGEIEAFKKRIDINIVRDEIKSLLSGIEEGAKRTAEIIRSLKNFSRLDENDMKPVDLVEGLDSTLVLIRSTFPQNLSIVKDYQVIPAVECMPGKINQVFMNLITNAVQAIKSKTDQNEEQFITLKTWQEGNTVKISVKDSGTGMSDEVKQKIFEPFFTTKDVGEGTGLGLSIVFRIIENHKGSIDVITKVNQGTEFIITLPIN